MTPTNESQFAMPRPAVHGHEPGADVERRCRMEPHEWPDVAAVIDGEPERDLDEPDPSRPLEWRADTFARLLDWLLFGNAGEVPRARKHNFMHEAMSRPHTMGQRLLVLAYAIRPDLLNGATLEEIAKASGALKCNLSINLSKLERKFGFTPYHKIGGKRKRHQRPAAKPFEQN